MLVCLLACIPPRSLTMPLVGPLLALSWLISDIHALAAEANPDVTSSNLVGSMSLTKV